MITLRNVLLALFVLTLVGGTVHALSGGSWNVAIISAILLALLLFERVRYAPRVDRSRGEWRPTGERFVDPSTGERVDVYDNPSTGERDYRTP